MSRLDEIKERERVASRIIEETEQLVNNQCYTLPYEKYLELEFSIKDISFLLDEISRLTVRIKAMERAATRDFEAVTGMFSFAYFCCVYKNREDLHKCELLGDEVCENMENWQFDEARFVGCN